MNSEYNFNQALTQIGWSIHGLNNCEDNETMKVVEVKEMIEKIRTTLRTGELNIC